MKRVIDRADQRRKSEKNEIIKQGSKDSMETEHTNELKHSIWNEMKL